MTPEYIISDQLVFVPGQVDLNQSPLRNGIDDKTYVLGAFNPGLCRLPNGNLLMMVRVAEALSDGVKDGIVKSIRWENNRYTMDEWSESEVNLNDPRSFRINSYKFTVLGLTSLSWLLPVELNADGSVIRQI